MTTQTPFLIFFLLLLLLPLYCKCCNLLPLYACLRHRLHLTRTAKLVCLSEVGLVLFQRITVWDPAFLKKEKKKKKPHYWKFLRSEPGFRHVTIFILCASITVHSLNPDMSTPQITLCVLLQLLMLDPYLFFELIFTCWSSNAAFLLSSCLFSMFQTQIFLLCAWHFMMYSTLFSVLLLFLFCEFLISLLPPPCLVWPSHCLFQGKFPVNMDAEAVP